MDQNRMHERSNSLGSVNQDTSVDQTNDTAEQVVAEMPLRHLVEILRLDQQRRLELGAPVCAENYFELFPALLEDSEFAVDVIYSEFLLGQRQSSPVDAQQFLDRFPQYRDELSIQFELFEALESEPNRKANDTTEVQTNVEMNAMTSRPVSELELLRQHALPDLEVEEEIGRGGMGLVYAATQISLKRSVAVKVLPFAAMLNDRQRLRFQNEAIAAGQLEHPHIVPVYTVGESRGLQYYVMQRIDGQSLDAIDMSEVSDTDLAQWVHDIATGLDHAHKSGVIHRDVKPSNVMVDKAGKAWIMDFGLAQFQNEVDLTMTGDLIGTARYMSPEQTLGQPLLVDHRSDVYSLGVTLYELLTGTAAYDASSPNELLRKINGQDPVAPRRIRSSISVDLQTIVMKALEKDRESRYQSAGEFAADLRRFLEQHPILAKRAGVVVRSRKWIQRNPGLLIASLIILVIATISLGASTMLIAQSRSRADQYFAASNDVIKSMSSKLNDELFEPGMQNVQEELLGDVIDYYDKFEDRISEDRGFRAEVASAHLLMAMLKSDRHLAADSSSHIDLALELCRSLVKEEPNNPERQSELAVALNIAGVVEKRRQRQQKAWEYYVESLEIKERLLETEPTDLEYRYQVATTLHNMGNLSRGHFKELDDAYQRLEQACKIWDELMAEHPGNHRYLGPAAGANRDFGIVLKQMNKADEALKRYVQAIDYSEELLTLLPEDPEGTTNLALSLTNAGNIHLAAGEYERAERFYAKATKLQEQLVQINPTSSRYKHDLAYCYGVLGSIYTTLGTLEKSTEVIARWAELVEEFDVPLEHADDLFTSANNYFYYAMSMKRKGDLAAAKTNMERSIQFLTSGIAKKQVSEKDANVETEKQSLSRMYNNLANIASDQLDWKAAIDAYDVAMRMKLEFVEQKPENETYRKTLFATLRGTITVSKKIVRLKEEDTAAYQRLDLDPESLFRVAEGLAVAEGHYPENVSAEIPVARLLELAIEHGLEDHQKRLRADVFHKYEDVADFRQLIASE